MKENVPIIGTKVISSLYFVQFRMTKFKKDQLIDTLKCYKLMGIEYIEPLNISSEANISKNIFPDDIKQLEDHAKNCNLCELSKKRSSFFFSYGDINSDILIVGTNQEFIENDDSFNLLKNMIEKVLMLKMDDIYITNILKCSANIPYGKSNEEINICIEYFFKQIEIIEPKLIITLGSSFNSLMKSDENILNISGNTFDFNGIKLVPLFDLDFIYKNPSYKPTVFKDLQKIKKLLESL